MQEYIGVFILFILSGLVGATFLLLAWLLGPKRPTPAKSEPFECGEDPFYIPSGRLAVKFYLVGMLFILFDVELVFLFPWAVVYRNLGIWGLIEMVAFLGIVLLGFVYAIKKGALEWR